jgi:hypothetical protein
MRIFRFRKPSRKGTILIDGSGSMHLDAETIAEMARLAPAATIAAYGGNHDDGPLRILAVNGKIADPKSEAYSLPGANVIDGPALRWLALQDRPRIWVCDGRVTGIGDNESEELRANARDLMRAGGIVRVRHCEDASALFDRRRARTVAVSRGLGRSDD